MDAIQFAFLSRQPSAAVKARDHFWGMPKRGLAFVLANVMFWQPMWAQATGIVVATPGTSLGQAGNGVPIVNIATPNGTGLSHNQFHDYNVGKQGVILNNVAARTGTTQLGGIIVGNPNLTNRIAAQTILNEVVGGSPSQLRGYTEVAGQSARVIVANPYGITCNGCGFINTPRVTLTTGKPMLDNGRLDRFQVDQGSVSINGAGLNANNIDSFEIITRSAQINAEIQAKKLTVVAGRNDVNAQTLNATARADDGSVKPQLAIDSSALGGMYAGAIKLVGTEAGVGVKLAGNLASSGGDIQIDGNGHLSLAQTTAAGAVSVKVVSLDAQGPVYAGSAVNVQTQGNLTNQQTLAARDGIALSAGGQLTNNGVIEAGVNTDLSRNTSGDVSITAQYLTNTGKSVVASRSLLVNTAQTLSNQSGTVKGQNVSISAGTLDNSGGLLSAVGPVTLNAAEVQNAAGRISSQTDLTAVIGLLQQQGGALVAQGNLSLTGATLDNRNGGLVGTTKALTLKVGDVDNRAGKISSSLLLNINSQRLDNSEGGKVLAATDLALTVARLINQNKGVIVGQGVTTLTGNSLDNRGGTLNSLNGLVITLDDALLNVQGLISTDSTLNLNSDRFDNSQKGVVFSKGASHVITGDFDNSQGGRLTGEATLDLTSKQVNNKAGRIASQQALRASVTGLDQQGGELFSKTSLSLDLNQGQLNNQNGLINAPGVLLLKHLNGVNNQSGEVSSAEAFTLTAQNLDNSGGKLLSNQGLTLRIAQVLNNLKGTLSAASIHSHSASLDNTQGMISSRGRLALEADDFLNNQYGTVVADGELLLTANALDNRGGKVTGKSEAALKVGHLDNQQGTLIATGSLQVTADTLDNRQSGLLGATKDLTLRVGELDNRGGELTTNANLQSTGKKLDNSDGGTVIAGKALALTVEQLLNRNKGKIDATGALNLQGRLLDNSAGNLVSLQSMSLNLSGAFNNTQGQVNSASTLNLSAAQVTNQDGGRIGSQGALTATVTGLEQQGGKLFSDSNLSLDLNNGQLNNQNGLINAPGTLLLKQLNGVNNQGGEISSAEAFTLIAQSLDNSNGKLLSSQGVTLRIANALDNVKGLIGGATLDVQAGTLNNSGGTFSSRGNLDLTVTGLLRNDDKGLINAVQTLNLNSADLNNQGGSLLGGAAVILNAKAVNNRDGGLINSKGHLTLAATTLDSSNGGEVSANGDIGLTLTALTQNGGRLLGSKAVTLDLTNGDLDNRHGLITAKGPLSLNHLGDLNNHSGEISSDLGFSVTARALDNSAGRLFSSQHLIVGGTSLVNPKGLISGWQGLTVNGDSLDNRDNGTLSSRNGDVSVSVNDALLNNDAGALVSQGRLSVKAGSLDNSDKGILSSAAGQILTVKDSLNNNHGGLIDSGAGLDITTAAFTNVGGTINVQQAFNASATTFDNSRGQVGGNAALTLSLLGRLNNDGGKLVGAGPVLIKGVTDLTNKNGQLASQSTLTLLTGSLDNSNNGTLAANDALLISASGAVQNNTNGLIFSKNAGLKLQAASLANGNGALQSQNGLILDVSGDLDNQSGKIIAENGNVSVNATNIDNRGGVLSSIKGALEARTVGVLRNGFDLNNNRQGGIIQGQRLTLSALTGLDNNGGRVSAQATDANITTTGFDNRHGVLYAKGLVGVTGTHLDNSAGQIAGSSIDLSLSGALNNRAGIVESDTTLRVTAASVDNYNGRLRSLGNSGKTSFQIGGLLDNRTGMLETANTDLNLAVGSFLNADGQLNHVGRGRFDIATANVINAGGGITSGGTLDLNVDTWTNSSVIQAGRLNVNVNNFSQTANGNLLASEYLQARGRNWTNEGLIASDGVLDMQLGGTYSGNGRLSSLGDINLNAAQLNLGAAGSIGSGANVVMTVGGLLSNAGRLTSNADLTLTAGALNNTGTLGSAQSLVINTPGLVNDRGLIFSGGDMTLNVGNFTNQNGDLYGMGDVVIKGNGTAQASQVSNISGSMESGGAFSISAGTFTNRTAGSDGTQNFGLGRTLISGSITVQCLDCRGDHYDVNFIARERFDAGQDSDTTASAVLNAGSNFVFNGGDFLNSKSIVSASGNITINANNLKNLGAVSGVIERTSTYRSGSVTDGTINRFMPQVVAYNQRNNPDFPNIYYIDGSGGFSTGIVSSDTGREPGHDGGLIEMVVVKDSITDQAVTNTLSGYAYGNTSPQSQYDRNNLVVLPGGLQSFTPMTPTETVTSGGSGGRNAVIQAGGNVSIAATQELQNSVIHEDYGVAGGTNKVADTSVGGTGTTVIRLNSQLPPDLAQQQVNPLSLPGFSLPAGDNGLFRLSKDGASDVAVADTQQPSDWSVSSERVNTQDHLTQGTSAGPRSLLVDSPERVSSTDRALDPVIRLPTIAQADAVNSVGPDTGARQDEIKSSVDIRPVTRVTGLPEVKAPANAHKYLIETNPVLTDLKQFMSSDYLLANLGYNPDHSAKRLGDGLYEQRLIQQAVVARTGQAFINGQTSNQDQFKYLMNNAIASKDALNLAVGVTLSAQQVAALTHDIVWLEEHEVNGEKVLVPVLYLAQAEGRLGPTGALIAGNDVTLIAGQNLDNVGTLRATHNLKATAGNDLINSGLLQAGNRLDVLAGHDVINKAGGILAGRDVSVTAIRGDVLNERTITSSDSDTRFGTQHHDYADTAARIEAINDLTLSAGQDIHMAGGVLHSGRDLSLKAGRDVNLSSVHVSNSVYANSQHNRSDITQLGATVTAGRDLSAQAGRDLNVIASQIDAQRDIAMAATENLTIRSAADEEHALSKSKKLTVQEDHVSQVMSGITAGGNVQLQAGRDLTVISSRITAGDEAYLVAGDNLDILAAQDSDYSLYDKQKKGSFGAKKTRRDEVTDVKNIGSEITSGGDLTLVSGGDQRYQVAKLDSGNDLTLASGGAITFEGVKDLHQESHEKSDSDLAWTSAKGKGATDETLRQSQLMAQGDVVIKAVDGLKIDIKHIDQKTVGEAIDAMVKADPNLAWLKEAEQRGDVDWRKVQELHDSFKYSHSGLGQGAMLAIIIIVTVLTAGAASAAIGTAANAAAASGTVMAAAGTSAAGAAVTAGWGNVALTAVATSAASGATVSTINNRGNLGAVAKDVTSSESLKNYVAAGVSGGIGGANIGVRLAVNSALQTVTNGGKFKDNLSQAAVGLVADLMAGAIYDQVGTSLLGSGLPTKVAVHAIVGGLIGEAAGGDFATSALAAGANKTLIEMVGSKIFPGVAHEQVLAMTSQLLGMTVAAAAGGSDKDQQVAGWVAQQATVNNYLRHNEVDGLIDEAKTCVANNCAEVRNKYADLNDANEKRFAEFCGNNPTGCKAAEFQGFVDSYDKTHEQISQARTSDIPLEMKNVLATVQMMNAVAKYRLIEMGVALGLSQTGSDLAGQAGLSVEPETVGSVANWSAILLGAGKAAGTKGTPPQNMSPPGAGRSGAFDEAKRQSGIPVSQQPSRVLANVDKRGTPQPGRIYEFEVPASGGGTQTIRIREDAGGHDFGVGNLQNRGPHFNDEAGNHYDY